MKLNYYSCVLSCGLAIAAVGIEFASMSCASRAASTVARKTAGTLAVGADEADDRLVDDFLARGGMLAGTAAACAGAALLLLLACLVIRRTELKRSRLQAILLEASGSALVLYVGLQFLLA